MEPPRVSDRQAAGYEVVFSGQKTCTGVAVLARSMPTDVVMGIQGVDDPQKRGISATVDGVPRVCA
jgi:exodeoxyribonuclease III